MWDWLAANSDVLSVLSSLAMLLVWIVYLQLFLLDYRRGRRPKILINRGIGDGLGSRCLLSNMSAEPIYIHSLVAELASADRRFSAPVTDLVGSDAEPGSDLRSATLQGPVAHGDFLDVGTFKSILGRAGWDPAAALADSEPNALTLTALATYGSERLIVGATRRFVIENGDGGWTIRPSTAETEQVRSYVKRRALHQAYARQLA
jgi:hypothetical protein